jgi:DNA excision repair protein ERCC-2
LIPLQPTCATPADATFLSDEPLLVAVRTLCHFTARMGDLDLRFTPSPTGTEGIAGHQTVTTRRGAGYQRELPLSARHGQLTVQGRADGFDASVGRVEEIKTRRGDAPVPPHHQALHVAQARVYGWMLCEQLSLDHIEVALVYYDIVSGRETVVSERCEASGLKAFFVGLCDRYLAWALSEQQHRRARDRSLSALMFPFDTFRDGQRLLAADVYRAQRHGRHLLAQAPTGIGKTLATLFGSLRAAPEQRTDRVMFLTARTTGRQLALDSLRQLGAGRSLPLRVLERVARDKACEHPDKACHGDACPLARGFYDRLPAAREMAARAGWLDRETLRDIALSHQVCPYFLGQEMQRWCDVLVGDYNHWFDVGAHWHTLTQDEGWRVALLVDEAHNLIERARKMYSAALDASEFLRLRRSAPLTIRQAMDTLHRRWSALAREHEPANAGTTTLVPEGVPADWLGTLKNTASTITELLALQTGPQADATLLQWAFEALHFVRIAERFGDHSLCEAGPWASPPGGRGRQLPSLRLRNVVPGPWLQERWQGAHSATLFSATLAPMAHVSAMLGLPGDTAQVNLPSPFAADQLQVRIAPWISTRYQDRERSLDALVGVMSAQYHEHPGNYLAFFSSFEYLERALQRLSQLEPSIPVWSQTRNMAEAQRDAFMARFDATGQGIGFAVLGGAFGEGIDLPGERLVGAFIATLGMPQVNADNERVKERLQQLTGHGHDDTYLVPGIMKVVQAAGRVIRREQDRGVVWLLDDRFARAGVRRLLPAWWRVTLATPP